MANASPDPRSFIWPMLLMTTSLVCSLGFACATPFAALAAFAALTMRRREAILTILAVWVVNQAIGFGIHNYPHRLDTLAWGLVIGGGALAAGLAATAIARVTASAGIVTALAAFAAAFAAYELVLFAFALSSGSGVGAFTAPIVLRILAINTAAFALLASVCVAADLVRIRVNATSRA